jgi:hypothetical protein
MNLLLEVALWLVLLPALAATAYLAILAVVALPPARGRPKDPRTLRRFAVVIPAHNEEDNLGALIDSLHRAGYPPELVHVTVVADNCGDATAEVARGMGVQVAVRTDPVRTGKGYALAYGIASLDRAYDAVLFVDADCIVSAAIFSACNARLEAGASVLQAHYTMAIDRGSSSRVARELALALVHLLRPRARSRLGLSAGLKGSGMCFRADVIERLGWTASGLAEDAEQHVRLVLAGYGVSFMPEASVVGQAPAALRGARDQHRRWEAGRASVARHSAPALVLSAIRQRSLVQLDTAAELLVPPLSVLATALAVVAAVAFAADFTLPAAAAVAGLGALAFYVAAGLILLRPRAADLARCLAALPWYAAWKVALYVGAIVAGPSAWHRSIRQPPESAHTPSP